MTKQALVELRDTIVSGKEHQLVGKIAEVFGPFEEPERGKSWLAYNSCRGSIDAAVAFLEAVLPDWDYRIYTEKSKHAEVIVSNSKDSTEYSEGFDLIPARALLLATLDALIERAE